MKSEQKSQPSLKMLSNLLTATAFHGKQEKKIIYNKKVFYKFIFENIINS